MFALNDCKSISTQQIGKIKRNETTLRNMGLQNFSYGLIAISIFVQIFNRN